MQKMIAKFALLFLLLVMAESVYSQHSYEEVEMEEEPDKKLFGKLLKTGSFEFHLRSYMMGTVNQGALTNYSTWGTGAGVGYFSPRWKGLGVGFSGFFVFRHFENHITELDPLTGMPNRYELPLYDVHHPENHKDMDRLEEFYISYESPSISAWFGRHHFESPLLNASDNRMRPNLFSGLSLDWNKNDFTVQGAWFTHVISRGSLEWLPVDESFGFYPTGRNPTGEEETYQHHIHTKGIGVLGLGWDNEQVTANSWSYLSEGVFATNLSQIEGRKPMVKGPDLIWGVQTMFQAAIGDGGNPDPAKAYILPGEKSSAFGMRAGLSWSHSKWTLNYLGFSDQGRFLFPREWGREQFFASLPRERFEGLGATHAIMTQFEQQLADDRMKVVLGASHVKTPDIHHVELNKYGIPSYLHFSGLADYRFKGFFHGLDLQLLVVAKKELFEREIPLEYVINRVEMMNFNLILDYRF